MARTVTKAQASAVFEVQPASGGDLQYVWMVSRGLVASPFVVLALGRSLVDANAFDLTTGQSVE